MHGESGPRVGQWWWNSDTQRLRIEPDADAHLGDISGNWSLKSLGLMLDGFSRSRLERALVLQDGESGSIQCAIGLSNGIALSLLGQIDVNGVASGELVRGDHGMVTGPESADTGLNAVFQPIISLSSGGIAGFEALERWGGAPPAAHSGGMGVADDTLAPDMLVLASEALASWRKTDRGKDLFVNVNLTGRDLAREGLTELVAGLVAQHGFARGQLRIELTEQAALRDAEQALHVTTAIKEAGAGVILDDFGTGHSSFSWLAALPADGLKIDPELTMQLDSEKVRIVLEAVTLLASRLKMSATAEGIESLDQVGLLRTLGFHYAQGFAFSHPVSAEEAGILLQSAD